MSIEHYNFWPEREILTLGDFSTSGGVMTRKRQKWDKPLVFSGPPVMNPEPTWTKAERIRAWRDFVRRFASEAAATAITIRGLCDFFGMTQQAAANTNRLKKHALENRIRQGREIHDAEYQELIELFENEH